MRAVPVLVALVLAGAAVAAQPTKKPNEADRGRDLYQRYCMACHGTGARGDGPASAALVTKPTDLQGKVTADAATVSLVLKGKGAMPSFEQSLTGEDAKKVLMHMKGLTDAPLPPPAVPAPPSAPVAPEEPEPVEGGAG